MSSEVMFFALFHYGDHPRHPSPMLPLLGKRSTTSSSLKGVEHTIPNHTYHFLLNFPIAQSLRLMPIVTKLRNLLC
jgi:hypothetical protein